MEDIKLVCLDLDGTTLRKFNNINKRTRDAIIDVQKKGIKVAIVSSRSVPGVMKHVKTLKIEEYNGAIANYNGVRIESLGPNQIIFKQKIEVPKALKYLEYLEQFNVVPLVYYKDHIISNKKKFYVSLLLKLYENLRIDLVDDFSESITEPPYKITFAGLKKDILKAIQGIYDNFLEDFHITISDYYVEVMDKGINKGNSIDVLKNFYNIDYKNILAFGDEDNDIEMISKAGYGVAMKNGVKHLKESADFITSSNMNNGVAKFLEKYILNK